MDEELNPLVEDEETTENVEETTEETQETEVQEEPVTSEEKPKGRFVTDEELNEIVDRRVSRRMKKLEKDQGIYKDTENVLKIGLGVNNIKEANQKLREYYSGEGYEMPKEYEPEMSDREVQALANADAEEIIDEGEEAMRIEANRLAERGYENLNRREKMLFTRLASTLEESKNRKELLRLGATEELINSSDFKEFAAQFNSKTPMEKILGLYNASNGSEVKFDNPGSMKNQDKGNTDKEYYTDEEIDQLTEEQLDDPKIWAAVRKSMTRQK